MLAVGDQRVKNTVAPAVLHGTGSDRLNASAFSNKRLDNSPTEGSTEKRCNRKMRDRPWGATKWVTKLL